MRSLYTLCANTEGKKTFTADKPKPVIEKSNSGISDELRAMRRQLKPVKPPVSDWKKTNMPEEKEDRKDTLSVSQGHVGNKPAANDARRPSKDATAPAADFPVLPDSRATNGNAKSPVKNAAVESKSFAPSPPLPSRTRQPSPSPQRNNGVASTRNLEPRNEVGGDRTKAPLVGGNENGGIVDNRHQPAKNSVRPTPQVHESTPTKQTETKRSGTPLLRLMLKAKI